MIEVEYAQEFLKDMKKLQAPPYYDSIKVLCFDHVPSLKSIADISSLKKLKGFDDLYRVRKGDLELG